jgi:hypothetical protein
MGYPISLSREALRATAHRRLSTAECEFVFRRLCEGALLVTVRGYDRGELGTSPLDELRMELMRYKPLELFFDARAATAAVRVSNEWTQFFAMHRNDLKRVSILVTTKTMNLTMSIAQHLSGTGNLIQIYSDPTLFDARVLEKTSSQ